MTCALLIAGPFCAGFACRWAYDHVATRRARAAALLVFIVACVAVIALCALGVVTVPYACTSWPALAPLAGAVAAELARDRVRRRAP